MKDTTRRNHYRLIRRGVNSARAASDSIQLCPAPNIGLGAARVGRSSAKKSTRRELCLGSMLVKPTYRYKCNGNQCFSGQRPAEVESKCLVGILTSGSLT